ncbi:unnamed protein product [Kluyveromyces dobzhanskii CBS 2104]|uniref:WGS project CCBQ000000000 data, contig 00099 n=1 Tax=Kluyveromyces dobzhanskii CBS 2104 TaxID=1427455 RepID=A0A0A8L4B5_9SACH|nr:unnamed protein product [Kluyveromyces dobzhanskii CBS 2104]
MNKVQKPTGTTHQIREQLNFRDDKKWKQFSSRRLELIDKFNLSERKASEQDENIRQIANILRTEYGYPTVASSEFEKLVTAAVQSVRRNRKRSTKTRTKRSELSSGTSDEESLISRTTSPVHSHNSIPSTLTPSTASQTTSAPSSVPASHAPLQPSHHHSIQTPLLNGNPLQISSSASFNNIVHPPAPIIQPKPIRMVYKSSTSLHQQLNNSNTFKQSYDEFMKDVIKDLTTNPINLQQQQENEQKNQTNLADLALSTNDFSLLNLALSKDKKTGSENSGSSTQQDVVQHTIPFFLKEKLMFFFQNSKTLIDLSSNLNSQENNNLLKLGQHVIFSSISFVLEKFFSNLSINSVDYIHDKLSSPDSLSEMCIRLIGSGTKRNLNQLPLEWRVKLLNFILGGVVKDFGFDPCVYPLTEIFHDSILKKYPLVCKEGTSSGTDAFKSAVIASLPLKPESANKDMNKKVVIKFGDREQRFVFHLLSNGAPTIHEILENSSSLFQINRDRISSLVILHRNEIIKDDAHLASLLNGFTNEEIVLEINDHSKLTNSSTPSLSGLQILSSVSQVAAENTGSSKSCITTLDNIISRIASPINPIKKEEASSLPPLLHPPSIPNKHGKNFANGLPQPVFQPLL